MREGEEWALGGRGEGVVGGRGEGREQVVGRKGERGAREWA